jgi:Zn-finger domain-containing protein
MTLQTDAFVVFYHCGKFHQNVSISSMVINSQFFLFTVDLDLERDLAEQFLSSLSITVLSFIEKYSIVLCRYEFIV